MPSIRTAVALPVIPRSSASALFEEIAPEVSGVNWRHVNGRSPEYYLPETTVAGGLLTTTTMVGWIFTSSIAAGVIFLILIPLRNALYHNNRDGTFTDVTEKAGVSGGGGYGMGLRSISQ